MTDSPISSSLSTPAVFLAGVGALLLIASFVFSALFLWHRAVAGSGATYILAPLWLPVAFAVCSALVVVASVALRRKIGRRQESSGRRFTSAAMLLTIVSWVICGIVWVAAGS